MPDDKLPSPALILGDGFCVQTRIVLLCFSIGEFTVIIDHFLVPHFLLRHLLDVDGLSALLLVDGGSVRYFAGLIDVAAANVVNRARLVANVSACHGFGADSVAHDFLVRHAVDKNYLAWLNN